MHEVLLLVNLLQTKPQIKNKNINYCDLCHTIFLIHQLEEKIEVSFISIQVVPIK